MGKAERLRKRQNKVKTSFSKSEIPSKPSK